MSKLPRILFIIVVISSLIYFLLFIKLNIPPMTISRLLPVERARFDGYSIYRLDDMKQYTDLLPLKDSGYMFYHNITKVYERIAKFGDGVITTRNCDYAWLRSDPILKLDWDLIYINGDGIRISDHFGVFTGGEAETYVISKRCAKLKLASKDCGLSLVYWDEKH